MTGEFTGFKDTIGNPIDVGDVIEIYPGFGCEWKPQIGTVWVDEKYKEKYRILRWDLLFIDMECKCEILKKYNEIQ